MPVSMKITQHLLLIAASLIFTHSILADEPIDGRFTLVDHNGTDVSEASYDGKLRLVFFGFTNCPIICPTTMIEVAQVMKQLGDRNKEVQPIFISIDPENDTVDVLAAYVQAFHPSIVGLTGDPDEIAAAARSFNVTYGMTPPSSVDEASEVFHSSYLYLMGRNGEFIDVFGYGARPAVILARLEELLTLPVAQAQIHVTEAWASKPAGTGTDVTAAFMCIENSGSVPIRIVDASSPVVKRIEIHRIQHEDGVVRMRRVDSISVAANQKVCLEPDGLHLMLVGLDEVVYTESNIPLQIKLASGEVIQTVLVQRSLLDDSHQGLP